MARMRFSLPSASSTLPGKGRAPPESPVPAPRTTTGTFNSRQARSTAAISAASAGRATAAGRLR